MEKPKSKLLTLIKLRLRELLLGTMLSKRNSSNTKTRSKGSIFLLYGVIILSFGFMFSTWFMSLALVLIPAGYNWIYMAFVSVVAFFMLFLGSVFMAHNQLFEAKDNELIMSLPVNSRDVLLSRMISLLALNYGYTILVAVPAGAVYLGFNGGSLIGVGLYIILMLFLPFLSMFFSLVLGWAIGRITARMKYKNVFSMIISVGAMLAYFYFIFTLQGRIETLEDVNVVSGLGESLGSKIPPALWFGKGVTEHNLLFALLFILICVIPFAVAATVLAKSYGKLAIATKNTTRIEYKGGGLKAGSGFWSIVKAETKRFMSSTTYMLNGGMGLIFVILMIIMVGVRSKEILPEIREVFELSDELIGPAIILIMLFAHALTIISSATISLEAKTKWILKSTPLKTDTILLGKAMPHILISLPFIIVAGIIAQFFFPMTMASRIGIFVIPALAVVFNAFAGVYINLCFPKFNWSNEAQAIKQGLAPFLAMLVNGLVAILVLVLFLIWTSGGLKPDFFLLLIALLYILLSLLVYVLMGSNGVKRWESL